jgi:lipocalin-like protein
MGILAEAVYNPVELCARYMSDHFPERAAAPLRRKDLTMPIRSNDQLSGTWKLVAASSATSTGDRDETPYGPGPTGFLTYTGEGRMCTVISYGGRKALSFGREGVAQIEEQADAFKTCLAYAGRYTLDGDTLTHHVEVSSIQNYVGRDLVRNIKFEGDKIILTTPPTSVNGKIQTVVLAWQRLRAATA